MSQVSYDQPPSAAANRKIGNKAVIGCITLFMLPFLLAGGGVMLLGIREFRRGVPTQQWVVPVVFGAVFVTFALGFVVMALVGVRNAARDVAARVQNPQQPWRWRKDWIDGVIVDRAGPGAAYTFVFAIIWNAISFAVTFFLLQNGAFHGPQRAVYIVLIFPLIGLILMAAALRQLLRRHKYGDSRLMLDHIPIVPGSTFRGDIDARLNTLPENGFCLRVMCVHRETTGSGRSRSTRETIIWADEQTVSSGAAMRSPVGTRVPFTFTIPDDARPTDERDTDDEIVWRVSIKAEVPGIDYAAAFDVPVFATGETPHAQTHYTVAPAVAATWTPERDSRIRIEPLPEGGEEVRVSTRARARDMFGLFLFAIVWYGVIGIMVATGVFIIAAFFGLFGAIVLYAILDNYLGTSIVRATKNGLLTRRQYPFGLHFDRNINEAEIESITANLALASQGAASTYNVDVTVRGGTHVTAARAIAERRDAEMLAVRLLRDLGRT